ncbi:hypothetical protein L7F22_012985 [Adiantum nelumboides]|nr:hypothetical protein [Adiantum nelumboides]
MGDAMKADGAFIGQDVSVTPLIGKLRLHIQGYVDKEDFFISPLKHEDVILGAPWFDCLAASIKFPERKISFKFREKDMYINAQEVGSTIPLVNNQAFDKSIKSSIFVHMIFIKDSLNGVIETQVNSESGMQEDLELFNFLNQFQDVFIDDIPGELPPKRGDDDHMIELIPGSSPPNKPPYRVSQAQQEKIMRQVNELVEKGMVPRLGLGCMGFSAFYGPPVQEEVAIELIKHAVNSGVSGDLYGPFTNEVLVGKAMRHFPRERIQLATKFGCDVENVRCIKGSADHVRKSCEASLKRLDLDYIDLYYQTRVDQSVPIEETVGELKKLVEEGKVKYIGLSEASPNTIRRAHAVHPITAVQLEWSLWSRDVEEDIIPTCRL